MTGPDPELCALPPRQRASTTLKYSAVALLGFVVDALALRAGGALGLQPFAARIISLGLTMQVTFLVNGLYVFRCLDERRLRQWLRYMGTNAVGNLANYGAFVTLVSLHRPVLSNHLFALAAGGLIAWCINYSCARWLVFTRRAIGHELAELAEPEADKGLGTSTNQRDADCLAGNRLC